MDLGHFSAPRHLPHCSWSCVCLRPLLARSGRDPSHRRASPCRSTHTPRAPGERRGRRQARSSSRDELRDCHFLNKSGLDTPPGSGSLLPRCSAAVLGHGRARARLAPSTVAAAGHGAAGAMGSPRKGLSLPGRAWAPPPQRLPFALLRLHGPAGVRTGRVAVPHAAGPRQGTSGAAPYPQGSLPPGCSSRAPTSSAPSAQSEHPGSQGGGTSTPPAVDTSVPSHAGAAPGSTTTNLPLPVADRGSSGDRGAGAPGSRESAVQDADIYWCREGGNHRVTKTAEVTTAQAGTEPLSITPSQQPPHTCFPPAGLLHCHQAAPRPPG